MIPTEQEYKQAKKITEAYEDEIRRLEKIRIEAFKKDLEEYFANNLVDRKFTLNKFELDNHSNIIPLEPYMEENYSGGNDEDIEKLCEKHNVYFSIVSWCYHK